MKMMMMTCVLALGFMAQAIDMPTTAGVMDKAKAKASNVMASCKEDTVSFCKEIKGVDKIKACLKNNVDKLTPPCKESVTKM